MADQYADARASVGSLNSADTPDGGADYPVSDDAFFSGFTGGDTSNIPRRKDVINYGTSQLSDPAAIQELMQDPNAPLTTKTNAVAAGLNTPGIREEYARRLGGATSAAEQEKAQIAKETDMLTSILSDAQTSAAQLAENKANIIREQQKQRVMLANEHARSLSLRGINTSDVNALVNTSAVDQLNRYQSMMQLKDEISNDLAPVFFEDPVGWLFGQLDAPGKIKQHNAIAMKYNATDEYINSSAAAAAHVRDANAGKIAAMTGTEAELLAQNQVLEAQKDLAKLKEDAIKAGREGRKEGKAIEDKLTTQLREGIVLQNAEEQHAWQRDIKEYTIAAAKEQRDLAIQQKKLAIKAMEEKADVEERQRQMREAADARVKAALGDYGVNSVKDLQSKSAKDKAQYEKILQLYDDQQGKVIYGATPQDVLTNTKNIGGKVLTPEQQLIVKSWQSGVEPAMAKTLGKPKEEHDAIINKQLMGMVDAWKADPMNKGPIVGGQTVKLFNVPPLEEIAKMPSLGGNPAAIKVTQLASATGGSVPINQDMLVTALAQDLKQGDSAKVTEYAKALSEFYKVGLSGVNKSLDLEKIGIKPLNSFPATVSTGMFGTKDRYDMTSVKDMEVALIKSGWKKDNPKFELKLPFDLKPFDPEQAAKEQK